MKKSEERSEVIEYSLRIEDFLNRLLCIILNINSSTSISFGTTNSALSINSKINLLIDFGLCTEEEKKSLKLFIQIRNKFAHRLDITTIKECLKEIDTSSKGTYTKLFFGITYPLVEKERQKGIEPNEKTYRGAFKYFSELLINDLSRICNQYLKKLRDSDYSEYLEKLKTLSNQLIKEGLKDQE